MKADEAAREGRERRGEGGDHRSEAWWEERKRE